MRVLPLISRARGRWSLVLAVGAFIIALAPLADGDLWWHLAAGRELVRTRAFLMTDPFSAGTAGRPWIDVHWLFQLAAYGLYQLGDLRAIVLAKCAVVAAGAVVLGDAVDRAAGRRARALFVPGFLLALFAVRALLLPRPIIATLLFLAADLALLERFRADGRLRWLAPLPLIQVAWANMQALSMLGPALVGAYALAAVAGHLLGGRRSYPFADEHAAGVDGARATRALLVAVGLCAMACFATPYGARAVALPFGLLARLWPAAGNVYAANVAENVPPWVLEQTSPGRFGHLGVYLALVALCLVLSPRLVLSRLIVMIALAALALASNRNVLLLYWLGTPIAIVSVMPALRRARVALRRSRLGRGQARAVVRAGPAATSMGVVTCVLAFAGVAAARDTTIREPAPWRAPTQSAAIIAARGGTGTVFAADQFGGYLMWRLGADHRPYMDTRLVLRTRQEFANYLAVVDDPRRFDAWERDHDFAYVLLPVAYPDRYLPLAAHLYGSERWELVFTDGAETLFARRDVSVGQTMTETYDLRSPAVVGRIGAGLERRFAREPRLLDAARAQLASLLLAVGEPSLAEGSLASLETPLADALRARARLGAGDVAGAARLAEAALARDASDVASLDVMALVATRQNDSYRARDFLRRALEIDPYDAQAGALLASWEAP